MYKNQINNVKTNLRKELSEEQNLEIKEAFDIYDDTDQGTLNKKKFKMAMRGLGLEPKKEEINLLFRDIIKSNEITYSQFYSIMSQKLLERDPLEEMKKAFSFISDDGRTLTYNGLVKIAKELDQELSEDELKEILLEADRDKDGEIGEEDFIKIMKKTNIF